MNELSSYGERAYLPLNYRIPYVKRCIGLPGDTLAIIDGIININGELKHESVDVKRLYEIFGNINKESMVSHLQDSIFNGWHTKYTSILAMSKKEKEKILTLQGVDSVCSMNDSQFYISRFPFVEGNEKYWSSDNYSSVYIPKAGATINLSLENLPMYSRIIEVYEKNVLKCEKADIYINGKIVAEYTFKQNYYFVMGDNRSFSMDSRNWGFVPEDHLIGKARGVVWSSKKNQSNKIRWDRIGKF
jgi:signal peptidase I